VGSEGVAGGFISADTRNRGERVTNYEQSQEIHRAAAGANFAGPEGTYTEFSASNQDNRVFGIRNKPAV